MEEMNLEAKKSALHYYDMAEKILLSRYKAKYYQKCIDLLRSMTESDADTEQLLENAELALNQANAGMIIEKYHFACMSNEHAKTSEDFGSAALHYEETAAAIREIPVKQELLYGEYAQLYKEALESEKLAMDCRQKSGRLFGRSRAKTMAGLALCGILALGVFYGRKTATFRNSLGTVQSMVGMYDSAAKNFHRAYNRKKIDKYYDRYVTALYKAGVRYYNNKNLSKALEQLAVPMQEDYADAVELYTDAEITLLQDAEVGDTVTFAAAKWIILDDADEQLLLIRNEAYCSIPYQDDRSKAATWEESSLREYLNHEYLDECFNTLEQDYIQAAVLDAEDNPVYGTEAGASTEDRIYILSNSEYEKYHELVNKCGHESWLRSPGVNEHSASFADIEKIVMPFGYDAASDALFVKPVLRISIK